MLIPEILENLPNDLERLLYVNTLKKQLEEQEKALKERLLKIKPKHSQVKYIERKTWKPGGEFLETIKNLDSEKKEIIEASKKAKIGSFEVTNYIQISQKEPKVTKPKENPKSQDFSSFFLNA